MFVALESAFEKGRDTETQPPPPAPLTLPAQQPLQFEASGRPRLPYVVRNTCMIMECRTRFHVVACKPAGLRSAAADTASILTVVPASDTVRVWQVDLHVTAPGVVVMSKDHVLDTNSGGGENPPSAREDTVRVRRGDTIFVLHDIASEERVWTHRAKLHRSEPFWPDHGTASNEPPRNASAPNPDPVVEEWWWVQPRRGAAGWWHAIDGRDGALQYPESDLDVCAIAKR